MIAFSCVSCGRSFHVQDERAGLRSRCNGCGAPIVVPSLEPVAAFDLEHPDQPARAPHRLDPAFPKRARRRFHWAISRDAAVALGVGAALAGVGLVVGFLSSVIGVLITVIHELGHTATAWVLASPALPTFDFLYGGGFSLIYPRQPLLVLVGCGWFAYVLWRARNDRADLIRWGAGAIVYDVALFSPLRDPIIWAMGHGTELLFAGIFLYRALSGRQLLRAEERPLYAALGFFILGHDVRFASLLITDAEFREIYQAGKGGIFPNDFDQIADNFGWTLPGIARLFLIPCALTPMASYYFAQRSRR